MHTMERSSLKKLETLNTFIFNSDFFQNEAKQGGIQAVMDTFRNAPRVICLESGALHGMVDLEKVQDVLLALVHGHGSNVDP